MMTRSPLIDQAAVNTFAFFAMFSRGLTLGEATQYLYVSDDQIDLISDTLEPYAVLPQVQEALLAEHFEMKEEGVMKLQHMQYESDHHLQQEISDQYWKFAKRYLYTLKHLPFIRMVGVCNTLAFNAVEDNESDIDLFIITKRNRIWIARLVVTLWFHMLGVRRHGNKVAKRFCLSFFIDETAMDLSSIAQKNEDVYLRFWIATMKPLLGKATYDQFIEENRTFLRNFLLWETLKEQSHLSTETTSRWQQFWETVLLLLYPVTWLLIWLQKTKMKVKPVAQHENSSVIVSDHMLKFHNNDRRARYREQWNVLRNKVL